MKLPLSIHARQIAIAGIAGIVALGVSWQANKSVLDIVISSSLNDKMDAQLSGIERAIDAQGRLDRSRILFLPDYDTPGSGWGWDVRTVAGHWHVGPVATRMAYANGTLQAGHGAYSGRGWTKQGDRVHLRQRRSGPGDRPVIVTVIAPDSLIKSPIRHALIPTSMALVLLALILAATALFQVRLGLRPVRLLRIDIARVRAGSLAALPENQPGELRPLAAEINALISQNSTTLHQARQHLANLAHGLKTPLASLSLMTMRDAEGSAEIRELIASIDNRVSHHLRRARSAAVAGGGRLKCDAWQIVTDLFVVLGNLHGGGALRCENGIPRDCQLAVDAEDFSEILGNLLENAFRHAQSVVQVSAVAGQGRSWQFLIEDDGTGIAEHDVARAMLPGRRLDETQKGYGLGLAIAKELTELYGGEMALAQSEHRRGLAVRLRLPQAGDQPLHDTAA